MEEKLPELPKGWVWTKLGEIGQIVSGGTPSTKEEKYYNGDIPWLTPIDLRGYTKKNIAKGRRNITKRGLEESSAVLLPEKTVLFTSRAPIGYVAIASNPICTNQGFKNIIVSKNVFFEYVYYYLKASKNMVERYASGTTFLEISAFKMKQVPFPLPPMPEQHRIVDKIEELFTMLDAGIESLKKVQAQIKRYRQAVLKHAFEGKLTAAWRETNKHRLEPASLLLEKVKSKNKENHKKQGNEVHPFANIKLPRLPDGWLWIKTRDVMDNIDNGYTPKAEFLSKNNGEIPFIKVYNLNFNGTLDFTKNPTFIPKSIHRSKLSRSIVYPSDLLINIVGPPLGKVAIVPNLYPQWNINQAIVRFRASGSISLQYFSLYMQCSRTIKWLESTSKATAGQYNINVSTCREIPVPFCSFEEQLKITEEIERRFSIADRIEEIVEQNLKKAERLRQSILKKAFEGKLVPQDPTDEPASVLLERIKAEKEKTQVKKTSAGGARNNVQ